jgi:hypothetical protein
MAGSMYGAAAIVFLTIALPEPLGWTVCFSLIALQSGIGAVLIWRRTRLQMMACSFVWVSGAFVVCAIAASRGLKLEDLFLQDPLLVVAAIAVPAFMSFSERWQHPVEWAQVRQRANESSLMDILTFRHIPDLRDSNKTREIS